MTERDRPERPPEPPRPTRRPTTVTDVSIAERSARCYDSMRASLLIESELLYAEGNRPRGTALLREYATIVHRATIAELVDPEPKEDSWHPTST